MFSRHLAITSAVAIMASFVANSASAATVLYTDRSAFQADAPGLMTEGFNSDFVGANEVDFGDFTVRVGRAGVNLNSANGATLPQLVSEGTRSIFTIDTTAPSTVGNNVRFRFDTPVTAFGIDINDHGSTLLQAANDGSLATVDLTTGQASLFFGVIDTVPFNELVISWNNAQDAVGFDNLEYGSPVPVPAAIWLFGSGLLGLIGFARSK